MDADALIQKLGKLNPKMVAVIEKYLENSIDFIHENENMFYQLGFLRQL